MQPSPQPSSQPSRQPNLQSFAGLRQAFAKGEDSPTAFLQRCLNIIDARDGEILAFIALDREAALRAAAESSARWQAGAPLSPIDGMPIGIKDVIETAGMPTGQGSERFAGTQTGRDAAAVLALREAGAVILGKTATTEFAATYPAATRNPCDLTRTPGGSSSGSAASISAGMLPAALGTQVVGSIIRPSSFCGVYGYKPSLGGLNRGGSNDQLSQSCMGVLGASLEDARDVAMAIAERVGGDPGFAGLDLPPLTATRPRALAVLELAGYAKADPAARAAFDALRARLQATGVHLIDRHSHAGLERLEQALADAFAESRRIITWESLWPMREYARAPEPKISSHTLARVADGRKMTVADYRAALALRASVRALADSVLGEFDGAISLAAPGAAPVGLEATGNPVQNVPASYLGTPVIGLPLMQADGLPLGLQVMDRLNNDAALFGVAKWLEEAGIR
ncbi:amidase [Oxalobacteraceae bacterium CAVE-383]|nr:amidase [Oxalobacteraceae bacterium CAVE-383]